MASIDKIYLNIKQYNEFVNYLNNNQFVIEKETGRNPLNYIYPLDCIDSEALKRKLPSSNFPEIIDRWLLENCPLDYIINRIKEQYGLDV